MKSSSSARPVRFVAALSILVLLVATHAPAARAQSASKIFVASTGSDSASGARNAPMRNFQAAHDAVAAGGEIVVLDTAGYGTLSISKSVTITVPPGVNGFITASTGSGITIGSGVSVVLRGLLIEAAGTASDGIYASGAASLRLENCTITGFGAASSPITSGGLIVDTSGTATHIVLSDTTISNCPGSGISFGIFGNPSAAATLLLEHCRILANAYGVFAGTRGNVTVRDSVVSGNTTYGIDGGGYGQGDVLLNVEACAVADNATGIYSFSPGNVTVSNTAITGNTTGVAGSSGAPRSFGNNQLLNNTTDGSFSSTVASK